MKRAKIVCTLGPACREYGVLKRMIQAGMNVARLNFSHGDHESHGAHLDNVRFAEKELRVSVGTMIDTRGPEIRTGRLENQSPIPLAPGDVLTLAPGWE
ncbi:MAG TPA: pyruvate kinase, partial [Synergistetes bacterium]|nr:pyruvate kinase [Synergistota bacterium]